ncbi:EamA family transporter [Nesterenkonia xinjiangensis]|uniref:Drug/metabolite transporter (DMT)-like permease n=1 Tax=Nesterenkonia xinjiangensis TaxID=225327 RepID=A0A7Z0KAT7_9MICC|nr:drug/metabolite transporter (DMT)-like permease [Nesterenkonia xinjiangensis]
MASPAPPHASDRRGGLTGRGLAVGLLIALVSAVAFGSSGGVAKGLLDSGWSPAAAVTVRVLIGAVVLLPLAVWEMQGRWHLLRGRQTWLHVALFGSLAVAGCQLFFFLAVTHLPVGVALMLEYLGPVLVVLWLWLARRQPPRLLTLLGIGLALAGLLLVLDVFSDVQISMLGVLWGLLAAVGLAAFFLIGADESTGLPPLAFTSLAMLLGAASLAVAGALGVVPFHVNAEQVLLAGFSVPWWVPVLWLGLIAAGIAYATGVIAARRLQAKLASFVGLTEVLFAVLWAWALLGELPAVIQLAGGLLILAGVICIRLDEPSRPQPSAPLSAPPSAPPSAPLSSSADSTGVSASPPGGASRRLRHR